MTPLTPGGFSRNYSVLVILVLVCAIWVMGAAWFPLPFWQITGDYSWYSLSHAFTLEARAGGFPASNFGYKIHPGIPFGVASWLSLRLATLSVGGSPERIAYGLQHAEEYWMWAKVVALLLNLGGLLIMGLWFRQNQKLYVLAGGTYFAALPAVYHVALFQLSIESLALIYVMSVYALGYLALAPTHKGIAALDKSVLGPDGIRDLCAAAIGVMTAMGCSMKIYYLAPTVGLICGALVAGWIGALSWLRVGRSAFWFLGGFVLAVLVVIHTILGWPVLHEWMSWNWQMLSHTGRYGTAAEGFISGAATWDALKNLSISTWGAFPALVVGTCTLSGLTLWRNRHEREWVASYLPFACAVLVAIAMNGAGLLKHYLPHYGIVIVAGLPCLVFVMAADRLSRRLPMLFCWGVALFLIATLLNVASTHSRQLTKSSAIMRDLSVIQALPIDGGQRRVWAYFSPSKQGVAPIVAQYSGARLAPEAIGQAAEVIDTVPNQYPEAEHWRYLVFPKTYYPTRDAILHRYKDMFDFQSTRYLLTEDMKFIDLETFIVVEREEPL